MRTALNVQMCNNSLAKKGQFVEINSYVYSIKL
jgi:hypothetical protein